MAIKTQAQIATEIATNITDNSNKENTASRVREVLNDINDSLVNSLDSTNFPKWKRISISYADFSAGATTEDISLYTLGINEYISDVKIVPVTPFLGGAIATYTLSVGIVGSLEKYALAKSVFTGNTTLTDVHTAIAGLESISATTDIRVSARTTVGNLNASTQGSAYIYILTSILP